MKVVYFTHREWKHFFIKMFFMMVFITSSCNRDFEEEKEAPQIHQNTEDNYKATTINLWGSPADVIDIGDSYIFQGDVVIKKEDLHIFEKDSMGLPLSASAARVERKWPNNKVYYVLNNISTANKRIFMEAISEIQEKTYLTFHQRYNESNYIDVKYHNTNEWIAESDWIGMKGGRQEINLSTRAWSKGVIIHEICHALGLYHEQCRADRDNYINVNLSVLKSPKDIYQFRTYKELRQKGLDIGEFDFNSVMLYGSYYVREDGETVLVMTKKDGSVFYRQRDYLSTGDAKGLIAIQPPIHFTFERDYPTPIFSPYKYETTKYLRCPENTRIKFGIAKRFEINYDLFKAPKIPDNEPVPPSFWDDPFAFGLGSFSLDEFDIKVTISIQKKDSYYPFYKKEIPFTKEIFKWEEEIVNIDIPKGLYSVKVSLTGKVKGTSDLRKEKILERILYSPKIFFKIEEVQIGGKNIYVPKDIGNDADLRKDTFIGIM